MKKDYNAPVLDVIKFEMNETITSGETFVPTLSPGVENWDEA